MFFSSKILNSLNFAPQCFEDFFKTKFSILSINKENFREKYTFAKKVQKTSSILEKHLYVQCACFPIIHHVINYGRGPPHPKNPESPQARHWSKKLGMLNLNWQPCFFSFAISPIKIELERFWLLKLSNLSSWQNSYTGLSKYTRQGIKACLQYYYKESESSIDFKWRIGNEPLEIWMRGNPSLMQMLSWGSDYLVLHVPHNLKELLLSRVYCKWLRLVFRFTRLVLIWLRHFLILLRLI